MVAAGAAPSDESSAATSSGSTSTSVRSSGSPSPAPASGSAGLSSCSGFGALWAAFCAAARRAASTCASSPGVGREPCHFVCKQ